MRPCKLQSTRMSKIRVSSEIHMQGTISAHERDTGKIPEDNHEAPLFMVHVPSLGNTFLSFSTMHMFIEECHRQD